MKKNFGRIVRLGAMSVCVLLTSCSYLQTREVTIAPASASEMESYYRDESFSRDGLSFESENFLRGNLALDDLTENPVGTLRKLNEYYRISENPKFLQISADLCRWIASRSSDRGMAIRSHLSALYYTNEAFAARMGKDASLYDFSAFRLMQIYNDSCRGIFNYLKHHKLLANNSFSLLDMEDRRYFFVSPKYHLSVPDDTVEDFSLCSDYSVKALMQKNRQPGIGIPLVGKVSSQQTHKILKSPRGLTIPVTLTLELRKLPSHVMEVRLNYLDTSLQETAPREQSGNMLFGHWPLALDFSTPLACFLDNLPDRNLLSIMLEPENPANSAGLYLIEPYQPNKIPVVFIHGLMSSPHTWVQMINALKNDPIIRKRYQFWFFSFSSGAPIMLNARNLRHVLLAARKELGTTPETLENFDKMVLIGHSMGGLVARTLLQANPHYLVEKVTHRTWKEICDELTPEELKLIDDFAVFPPLQFIGRVVFMAVPHRGSEMAQWSIARYGARLVQLPKALRDKLPLFAKVFRKLNKNKNDLEMLRREKAQSGEHAAATGLHDLEPNSLFIRALSNSPMKEGLIYHSIIGDQHQADHPGGSDGIVPYSSSHLDNAASEVIVHSGHSIHRSSAAMRELLRILRLHLRELERTEP